MTVGMQNGTATLEDSLVASYKNKQSLSIWSSSHTPRYLPKWVEKLCPHKNLHTNGYNIFIHIAKI